MKTFGYCRAIFLFAGLLSINSNLYAQNAYRDYRQQPVKIMDAVGIKEGMIIGEAGAGEGYFTFHLAKRVGEKGRIYANDIKNNVLRKIEQRCKQDSIQNITTILGDVDKPKFPENQLDMVIMLKVFHEMEEPVAWMKNVISSMKPDAPLVIIDLDPRKAGHGWDHFLTREEINSIMEETDFKLIRIEDFLEEDVIYIYKLKEQEDGYDS